MNKRQFLIAIFAVCLSIIISACATTSGHPILKKNAYYKSVGSEQAEQDIKQAVSESQKAVDLLQESRKKDIETTVKEGAVSSGTGTLTSLITGRAALGIVAGSGPKVYSTIKQKEEDKIFFRKNVEKRLKKKGYQIKYWK
ncbi:MAG: hypothetical protein KOO69_08350 [Victivallales bacterium]|nr:hypothetical protein [Victivallales bacterium]